MRASVPPYLFEMPIYKKAQEIFKLSQLISVHLQDDLSDLDADGKEDNDIYSTGDMIWQSNSLGPEIIKAEMDHERRYVHARTLEWLTLRLQRTCKRLERSRSNARDLMPVLRTELRKFRRLQRSWMYNL